MPWFTEEKRRRFPRIKTGISFRYEVRGFPDYNNLLSDNISLNGLGFTTNKFIAPETAVNVDLNILSRIIKLSGKVAWASASPRSDRYHFGIEFEEMNALDKNFLSDYIAMQLNQF